MKVIFLDIDGVLNVISQPRDKYGSTFHQHLVDNLEYVIKSTDAKLVISSSWRLSGLDVMQDMWKYRNLPGEVIDITPDKYTSFDAFACRGDEINFWLNIRANVESYVILDDDDDMLDNQIPFFIQTSGNQDHEDCVDIGYGLTRICADKAIKILNKDD